MMRVNGGTLSLLCQMKELSKVQLQITYIVKNVVLMDKQQPINFVHACALLYQYCQLPWARKLTIGRECFVRDALLELNIALQLQDKARAKEGAHVVDRF